MDIPVQTKVWGCLLMKMLNEINYFQQILTEHADYVTTFNSLNTISCLCAIIRSVHIPFPLRLLHLVNGWTCKFCLICPLDSLDNPLCVFACRTCLDMKQKSISHKYVIWIKGHFPVKGEFGLEFLVTSIPHFWM